MEEQNWMQFSQCLRIIGFPYICLIENKKVSSNAEKTLMNPKNGSQDILSSSIPVAQKQKRILEQILCYE